MADAATVTVWLLDSSGLDTATLAWWAGRLGDSERARLARFRRAARRRQFIAGRMLLRHALAQQANGPQAVTVTERPGMAPLVVAASGLVSHFSLSHSGPWIACAVSAACAVGVDVEIPDPARDLAALAAQAFSADDAAGVAAVDGDARTSAFYQLWCRDEARYKLGAEFGPGHEYRIAHEAVEIGLCSAQLLAKAPALKVATIAALHDVGRISVA